MSESNKIVVYAALFGNLAIALVKFVASYITNSSAMFSEAIHSVVDTLNEILLLYGMKKSEKPANAKHPFGYGRLCCTNLSLRLIPQYNAQMNKPAPRTYRTSNWSTYMSSILRILDQSRKHINLV